MGRVSAKTFGVLAVVGLVIAFSLSSTLVKRAESPGAFEADQVVVATGPFQTPRIPSIAAGLAAEVHQLHSSDYRRPDDVEAGPVLVVGGGNTGFQIAHELAATNEVHLAVGSRQTPLPQRAFGRDVFTILTATGLMGKTVDSRIGRRLSGRDALIGSSPGRSAGTASTCGHERPAPPDRRSHSPTHRRSTSGQ